MTEEDVSEFVDKNIELVTRIEDLEAEKASREVPFDRESEGWLGVGWLPKLLEGPFSAVSKPTFATTADFCSISQDLLLVVKHLCVFYTLLHRSKPDICNFLA